MNIFISFIIGAVVGFVIAKLTSRSKDTRVVEKSEQEKQKNKNLDAVLAYIKEHREARNNDVEKLLNVSDATATRYLEELEKSGVIEQIGDKGRSVKYRLR